MTTYTAIANTDIDQDSPVTQPLMTAMRDNPIAMAEGASGAPKLRTKNVFGGGSASGDVTTNYDFTGLDNFGGARFFIEVSYTGSLIPVWEISADAGAGFGAATTFFGGTSSGSVSSQLFQGYWNKITGSFEFEPGSGSVTVANTGSGVTTLRFTTRTTLGTGGATITCYIYLMPDGGESTT